MAKTFRFSPFGETEHPWINKPDTKYNEGGVFKAPLWVSGPEAEKFAAEITTECDAAHAEYTKDMTPAERKKWSVYYPFEREENEDGTPTGRIKFDFKQNATIRLKDKTTKAVTIGIYDSSDAAMSKPIFSGSELRCKFSTRIIPIVSAKEVGVRLDFAAVQVRKLVSSSGGGARGGFGSVEGGYEDEAEHAADEAASDY